MFVRSPESDGWVSSYDLPEESAIALHQRIDGEGIPEKWPFGEEEEAAA